MAFIKAFKQYRAAKKKIAQLKPIIASRKVEGAMLRGEKVSVAQTRKILPDAAFNGEQVRVKSKKKGGYR